MNVTRYDRIGVGYSKHRRPDRRLASRIEEALGSARRVLNVGAGTGSYEPEHRRVLAVEPSVEMIGQRPAAAAPAIRADATRLPFPDRSFDATLAILTLHHWSDRMRGLAEMRRVARDRVVILTWDPDHEGFWLGQEYFPEILAIDRPIFPTLSEIRRAVGPLEVRTLPIPIDCADGFLGAYWGRPEAYLEPSVRAAISTFARIDPSDGLARLRLDLDSGTWDRRYGGLRARTELDVGYRLVVAS
ncbi:MAG: class I SAM-dependent methyltransferase [bacterium]